MNKTYTALSIGPIYKTLTQAKKTREIWGGSFIFSYIMKEIIKKINKEFITPYVDKTILNENSKIGKFHDRLIFEGDEKELLEAIENTKEELVDKMVKDLNVEEKNIREFVDNYFKFYIVSKELKKPFNKDTHPIKVMNDWLNIKELFFEVKNYKKNYLFDWLRLSKNNNSLFKSLEDFNRFKSLPEIALSEIIKKDKSIKRLIKKSFSKDEIEIFEKIEKNYKLKPYHKYIAIVHVDGDNLSKVLSNGEDLDTQVKEISKKLFEFSKKAVDKIEQFEGEVIYAGGDDLLFFAPVFNGEKSVFDLISDLKDIYEKEQIRNSTISCGVSITYYKFPLNEALEESRNLLYKAKENNKNSTAFRVIKHSGQYFEGIIKHTNFEKFLEMINYSLNDEEFLHSIYTKISFYKEVIKKTPIERMGYFFENNFNENYNQYKNFFAKIIDYYEVVKDVDALYSTLRFMKFLKGNK